MYVHVRHASGTPISNALGKSRKTPKSTSRVAYSYLGTRQYMCMRSPSNYYDRHRVVGWLTYVTLTIWNLTLHKYHEDLLTDCSCRSCRLVRVWGALCACVRECRRWVGGGGWRSVEGRGEGERVGGWDDWYSWKHPILYKQKWDWKQVLNTFSLIWD